MTAVIHLSYWDIPLNRNERFFNTTAMTMAENLTRLGNTTNPLVWNPMKSCWRIISLQSTVPPDEIILATNFNVKSAESKEADLNDPQNDMEDIEIMIKFIKPTLALWRQTQTLKNSAQSFFLSKIKSQSTLYNGLRNMLESLCIRKNCMYL